MWLPPLLRGEKMAFGYISRRTPPAPLSKASYSSLKGHVAGWHGSDGVRVSGFNTINAEPAQRDRNIAYGRFRRCTAGWHLRFGGYLTYRIHISSPPSLSACNSVCPRALFTLLAPIAPLSSASPLLALGDRKQVIPLHRKRHRLHV